MIGVVRLDLSEDEPDEPVEVLRVDGGRVALTFEADLWSHLPQSAMGGRVWKSRPKWPAPATNPEVPAMGEIQASSESRRAGATIMLQYQSARRQDALAAGCPPLAYERPTNYGECLKGGVNEERPCPWVSCKYHLYLRVADAVMETPSILLSEAGDVVDVLRRMPETCSLDVADWTREATLEEIGDMLGLTRERVRQIEAQSLAKLYVSLTPQERVKLLEMIRARDESGCLSPWDTLL